MATTPKTADEYLKAVSADKRAAFETLRKNIQAAAPKIGAVRVRSIEAHTSRNRMHQRAFW